MSVHKDASKVEINTESKLIKNPNPSFQKIKKKKYKKPQKNNKNITFSWRPANPNGLYSSCLRDRY